MHGNVELLRTLLLSESAADQVEWLSRVDPTPLLIAVLRDHRACAELLIEAGADLNVSCGADLKTALHVCCARGNAVTAKALIAGGAYLCKPDARGRSPLVVACMADQPECAAVLLAAGANIEQPMNEGQCTPLYVAAAVGSLRCVSLLCEAGARVNARTSFGASPALAASQGGHLEMEMLLASYGAVLATPEAEGMAPPMRAIGDAAHTDLPSWMRASYRYTALHHVHLLTPRRAVALLRAGCSPHARAVPLGGSAEPDARKSPVELVREHAPHAPAAKFILRAAEPWSIRTHDLWGAKQRARAVALLKLGYQLAHAYADSPQGAFLDVWLDRIMPRAISWSNCQAVLPAQRNLDCSGSCPACPRIRPAAERCDAPRGAPCPPGQEGRCHG